MATSVDSHTAPELRGACGLGHRGFSVSALLKCCFTSTETGPSLISHLASVNVKQQRRRRTETVGLLGTGAYDGHLDFHTTPALSALRLGMKLSSVWDLHNLK